MIVLNATPELKLTFDKLIRTMEANVSWNGLFVVIDNTLILQGEVRSLFFHFDSRKVVTNIIDLDIPVHKIKTIETNPYMKNVLNMVLYAFGKWGNIKGLTVEKDYTQLGRLFRNILGEIGIESEYNKEHFWFYQKGVRILYEDVVECAISYQENVSEAPEEESRGLWHKLIWEHRFEEFSVSETTVKERNRNRLGNNFYLTGYLCPVCQNKMHGVVYPPGKEFIIDTDEGRVQIARAYTCGKCHQFYTPRPQYLLIDGDCYRMDFEGDTAAYQDYQELLGKNGAKVSNPNYNIYLDRKKTDARIPAETSANVQNTQTLAEMRDLLERADELSERELEYLLAKLTEGFFPEKEMETAEKVLWEKHKNDGGRKRKLTDNGKKKEMRETADEKAERKKVERYRLRLNLFPRLSQRQRSELIKQISGDKELSETVRGELLEDAKKLKRQDNYKVLKEKIGEAKNKNRFVMLHVYDAIENAELDEEEREELFEQTGVTLREYRNYLDEKKEAQKEAARRTEKVQRLKMAQHTENAPDRKSSRDVKNLPDRTGVENTGQESVSGQERKRIPRLLPKRGNEHVQQIRIIKKEADTESAYLPKNELEKSAKKSGFSINWSKKMKNSKKKGKVLQRENGQKQVKQANEVPKTAREKEEDVLLIEDMIRQTKSSGRTDLQQLLDNLSAQGFDEDILAPYKEHVKEQIRKLDEVYLDSLLGDFTDFSSEEGAEIYEQIEAADILPELKANALKQLETRLSKMKTEECELLILKLQKKMEEAGLKEPDRHYYYPAKKVLLKEPAGEAAEVIAFAKAAYGAGMGPFEYPIWAVDTSFNRSGGKGMFLTPENLYYSNLTTSYHIPIAVIERIETTKGILGSGLYAYGKNEKKIKLPYVVDAEKLPVLAKVLDEFVKYLQEKPFSRKEAYLAEEKHDEICCFRCGYVYHGTDVCPKCGYKANQ